MLSRHASLLHTQPSSATNTPPAHRCPSPIKTTSMSRRTNGLLALETTQLYYQAGVRAPHKDRDAPPLHSSSTPAQSPQAQRNPCGQLQSWKTYSFHENRRRLRPPCPRGTPLHHSRGREPRPALDRAAAFHLRHTSSHCSQWTGTTHAPSSTTHGSPARAGSLSAERSRRSAPGARAEADWRHHHWTKNSTEWASRPFILRR